MFADMTLQELNALAERQRRQIEEQEKSLQVNVKRTLGLTVLVSIEVKTEMFKVTIQSSNQSFRQNKRNCQC